MTDEKDETEEPMPAVESHLGNRADSFEIDRGFDPDYFGTQASPPHREADQETSEPLSMPFAEPELEDAPHRLTEVADDDDLFQDPDLEIVRLDAGGVTEVVIPVEIGQGETRQRFKLSLNLRLDRSD